MSYRSRLIAGALLLASVPAYGADLPRSPGGVSPVYSPVPDWGRFYLALHGGANFLQGSSLDYVNGAAPNRGLDFNTGWALTGAAGYRATPWLRVELEGGTRSNAVNAITPGSGVSGSASATTLMANGYIDIPNQGPVTPYVGAGIGKAWLSHNNLAADGITISNTTSWRWALPVIAGASMPVAPQWSMNLEYRYLATQCGLFQDTQGLFYNSNYNSQAVMVGVSWRPW